VSERTAVYRLYGAGGELLYVGISKSFGARWEQHAYMQPWWPEVQRQTVEWHPDRQRALTAEEAAIRSEGPRHNILHNPRRPRRTAANKLKALTAGQADTLTGDVALLHSLAVENQVANIDREATRDALIDAIWEASDQDDIPQVDIAKETGFTRERLRQLALPEYRAAEMKRRAER
jgi:hypothetical protein